MADYLVSGAGATPYLYIWDTSNWSKIADPATLPTALATVFSWAPDNSQVAVANNGTPRLIVYETSGWTKLSNPGSLPSGTPNDISFSPDGVYLVAGYSVDPRFVVWLVSDRSIVSSTWTPGSTVNAISFSPSGGRVAVATTSALYICDPSDSFNPATDPIVYNSAVTHVQYSPDGTKLSAVIGSSPNVKTWSTSTGTAVSDPTTIPSGAYRLAYSPDSSKIAVGCTTGTLLRIYSSADWSLIATPTTQPAGAVRGIDWSADGTILAVRSDSGTPSHRFYNTSTWATITGPGTLPAASFGGLAFSNLANTSLSANAHASSDATGDIGKVSLSGTGHASANSAAQFAGGAVHLSASAHSEASGLAAEAGPVTQAQTTNWRPIVTIGSTDYSARLVGTIEVERQEDSATICGFSVLPFSGTIYPQQMIGKSVTVSFATRSSAGAIISSVLVFSGIVDVPSISSDTGILKLSCTDDFQGVIAAMDRAQIDASVGGIYSPALYKEDSDNWIYMQHRMDSLQASCELGINGGLVVTPWKSLSNPHFSFTDSSIISADFDFASRSGIQNRVKVKFEYQSQRLKKRVVNAGYNYPFSMDQITINGYSIPSRSMISQAIHNTGWEVNGDINFIPCPAAPQAPINLGGGTFGVWAVTPDVAIDLCFGFVVGLKKRFAQKSSLVWDVDVKCDASITALGEIKTTLSGGMQSSFDSREWESYKSPSVVDGVWSEALDEEPEPIVPDPLGEGETYVDPITGNGDDMPDAMYALEVLVAQAKRKIVGSHRSSGVTITMPIQVGMTCAHTVAVNCASGLARGKVRRVRHTMNLDSGKCISVADIAISSLMGTGFAHPSDNFISPEQAPNPASSSQDQPHALDTYVGSKIGAGQLSNTMFGYFTNVQSGSPSYSSAAPVYPVQFVMQAPAIGGDSRSNGSETIVSSSDVAIIEDPFEVYVP